MGELPADSAGQRREHRRLKIRRRAADPAAGNGSRRRLQSAVLRSPWPLRASGAGPLPAAGGGASPGLDRRYPAGVLLAGLPRRPVRRYAPLPGPLHLLQPDRRRRGRLGPRSGHAGSRGPRPLGCRPGGSGGAVPGLPGPQRRRILPQRRAACAEPFLKIASPSQGFGPAESAPPGSLHGPLYRGGGRKDCLPPETAREHLSRGDFTGTVKSPLKDTFHLHRITTAAFGM